jgi:Pyruvate/2-oxoacid:ferredoxin oxidoreductase gamma subunit
MSSPKTSHRAPSPKKLILPPIFNILIVGVGGQGVITLGKFFQIYGTLDSRIQNVIATENRGVAQREGSVKAIVRYICDPLLVDRKFAPVLNFGEIHLVIALEPLEFLRHSLYLRPDANVILNTQTLIPKSCFTQAKIPYPRIEPNLEILKKNYPKLNIISENYYKQALEQFNQSQFLNQLMVEALSELKLPIFEPIQLTKLITDFFHYQK